jgi:pSer/pThr/pTyr-binding forkhead associated (FHA) protein
MTFYLKHPLGSLPLDTYTRIRIGRADDNEIQLYDAEASDYHAVIELLEDGYSIEDLGSQYGTFVNQVQLIPNQSYKLLLGNEIRIGQTTLTYYFIDDTYSQSVQYQSSIGGGGCTLGGFVLLVILAVIVYFGYTNYYTPNKTLTDFCNALHSKDYQTAYDQLSNRIKKQGTEQKFASTLQQTFAPHGNLKNCIVSNIQQKDTTTTGEITFVFADGKTLSNLASLIVEDTVWRIDSTKSLKASKWESIADRGAPPPTSRQT